MSGNTISWDADGWYQVQRPASERWDLCNSSTHPDNACDVSPGTYTIINHDSGERWSVAVPADGTGSDSGDGGDAPPVTGEGSGDRTGSLGPQPDGSIAGTDFAECESRTTWAFLQGGSSPLVGNFFGGCAPGEGLLTRAWFVPQWAGQGVVNTGTAGRNFWIDWENMGRNDGSAGHAEFDIGPARTPLSAGSDGYGEVRIRNLPSARDLTLTARARWADSQYASAESPGGKSHVQTIIWINRERGAGENAGGRGEGGECLDRQSIDITVVDYMGDEQRDYYFDYADEAVRERPDRLEPPSGLPDSTGYIDDIDSNGSTYRMFRRLPGDECETASFLAIRTDNRFENGPETSVIDPRRFIDYAIDNSEASDGWFVSVMGWEVAGATRDQTIPDLGNSSGKFVFECYSVPALDEVLTGEGYGRCP